MIFFQKWIFFDLWTLLWKKITFNFVKNLILFSNVKILLLLMLAWNFYAILLRMTFFQKWIFFDLWTLLWKKITFNFVKNLILFSNVKILLLLMLAWNFYAILLRMTFFQKWIFLIYWCFYEIYKKILRSYCRRK